MLSFLSSKQCPRDSCPPTEKWLTFQTFDDCERNRLSLCSTTLPFLARTKPSSPLLRLLVPCSDVTRTFEEQHPDMKVPGLMAALSGGGYHTAIYSPMRRWHSLDEEMFQELGVQQQIYPPDALLPPESRQDLRAAWMRTRIARDLATLELMKRDLGDCLAEGHNFAAVFLPQISHLPYLDVAQNEPDIRKRARAILEIGGCVVWRVAGTSCSSGINFDNTVIVITGDHGIRTSEEDPHFIAGMIDEYSFHVPLLIYAPKVLHHSFTIPWLTSHIDVAPTVLDLLGVERGRDFEEGSPIWNADLAKKTNLFLRSFGVWRGRLLTRTGASACGI